MANLAFRHRNDAVRSVWNDLVEAREHFRRRNQPLIFDRSNLCLELMCRAWLDVAWLSHSDPTIFVAVLVLAQVAVPSSR